jgi:glycopeptide antibiotics resistance protein
MLDGGVFLVGLYTAALLAAVLFEWRLLSKLFNREDRMWAAVVTAVNVGTLALIFTFVPFGTQVGLQYWFLEGALHGAMVHRLRK